MSNHAYKPMDIFHLALYKPEASLFTVKQYSHHMLFDFEHILFALLLKWSFRYHVIFGFTDIKLTCRVLLLCRIVLTNCSRFKLSSSK